MRIAHQFQIGTTGSHPALTSFGNEYVLTWLSDRPAGLTSPQDIYAQRYSINNTKIGNTLLINPEVGNQNDYSITALPDKGFVIAWSDCDGSYWKGDIYAKHYYKNNTASPLIHVNDHKVGIQTNPSVTGLKNGGFVISWIDTNEQSPDIWINPSKKAYVYAKHYNADNSINGTEFVVDSSTKWTLYDQPSITSLSDNSYILVCCANNTSIYHFDSNNTLVHKKTLDKFHNSPVITSLENSKYVLAEIEKAGPTKMPATGCVLHNINIQNYHANDTEIQPMVTIQQNMKVIRSLSISDLTDGGYVLTWSGYCPTNDSNKLNIYTQVYNTFNKPVGTVLKVLDDIDNKNYPVIDKLSNGGFILAWQTGQLEASSWVKTDSNKDVNSMTIHIGQLVFDFDTVSSSTGGFYKSSTGINTDTGSTGAYHGESSTGEYSISSGLESYYLDEMAVLVTLAGSILYQTFNTDFFDN